MLQPIAGVQGCSPGKRQPQSVAMGCRAGAGATEWRMRRRWLAVSEIHTSEDGQHLVVGQGGAANFNLVAGSCTQMIHPARGPHSRRLGVIFTVGNGVRGRCSLIDWNALSTRLGKPPTRGHFSGSRRWVYGGIPQTFRVSLVAQISASISKPICPKSRHRTVAENGQYSFRGLTTSFMIFCPYF